MTEEIKNVNEKIDEAEFRSLANHALETEDAATSVECSDVVNLIYNTCKWI
jgi:hypothetical protein